MRSTATGIIGSSHLLRWMFGQAEPPRSLRIRRSSSPAGQRHGLIDCTFARRYCARPPLLGTTFFGASAFAGFPDCGFTRATPSFRLFERLADRKSVVEGK